MSDLDLDLDDTCFLFRLFKMANRPLRRACGLLSMGLFSSMLHCDRAV